MSLAIFERAGARERLTFGSLTSAVFTIGLALAAVFFFFPDIDLQFARMFYRPGVGFTGNAELAVSALRWFFIGFYYSCIALTVVGLVRARAGRRSWLKLRMAQWLFLATCLGVGPGLVANVLLKQQVGRARPQHLVEFGGTKAFTAPFVPARECRWACSFVSGEAAAVVVPFYAVAVLIPQWSLPLAASGTVAGLVAGLIRVSQGAHFLSDVIFALVFMALTVLVVHRVVQWSG
jgi:lipid A 4'-phosphatase